MIGFWIAALALGLVAAAVVFVPVLRGWLKQGEGRAEARHRLDNRVPVGGSCPEMDISR